MHFTSPVRNCYAFATRVMRNSGVSVYCVVCYSHHDNYFQNGGAVARSCIITQKIGRRDNKLENKSSTMNKFSKSSNWTSRKYGSSIDHSDEHKADWHDKKPKDLKILKFLKEHFTKASVYMNYRIVRKLKAYAGGMVEKSANWAERMDVQRKLTVFRQLYPISKLSFLSHSKMACSGRETHKRADMRLLHCAVRDHTKGFHRKRAC